MNKETYTLDKFIAALEKIRAEHGGALKVMTHDELGYDHGLVGSDSDVIVFTTKNGEKRVFIDYEIDDLED